MLKFERFIEEIKKYSNTFIQNPFNRTFLLDTHDINQANAIILKIEYEIDLWKEVPYDKELRSKYEKDVTEENLPDVISNGTKNVERYIEYININTEVDYYLMRIGDGMKLSSELEVTLLKISIEKDIYDWNTIKKFLDKYFFVLFKILEEFNKIRKKYNLPLYDINEIMNVPDNKYTTHIV